MRSDSPAITRMAILLACVTIGVTACSRGDDGTGEADQSDAATEATPLPPAATMHPDDVASVTASYDCDGIRVDVVRDQVARVNLAVDNIIKIERIKDSVPATYQDVGLTLTTTETGAELDDESGRNIACNPVARPTN